jgi:hypothetical protein
MKNEVNALQQLGEGTLHNPGPYMIPPTFASYELMVALIEETEPTSMACKEFGH